MISSLAHIGIVVNKLGEVLPIYEKLLGMKLEKLVDSKQHGVKAAVLAAGDVHVELLEPLDKESPISKFLGKRDSAIHHVAFAVENIEEMLTQLKDKGVRLIDERPRIGIEGGKIAFIHPKSTGNVLIELCEL